MNFKEDWFKALIENIWVVPLKLSNSFVQVYFRSENGRVFYMEAILFPDTPHKRSVINIPESIQNDYDRGSNIQDALSSYIYTYDF